MKNKIFLIPIILLLVAISVSATSFKDTIQRDFSKNPNYTLIFDKEECNDFDYFLIKQYFKDFTIEIKTYNTKEHFYIVIKENKCKWYPLISNKIRYKADIVVEGDYFEKEGEWNLENWKAKTNTLRGKLVYDWSINSKIIIIGDDEK